MAEEMRIERWKSSRGFALYDENGELICITLYRKGAVEVRRQIQELRNMIERGEHETKRPSRDQGEG
jgi:hypothetical protein